MKEFVWYRGAIIHAREGAAEARLRAESTKDQEMRGLWLALAGSWLDQLDMLLREDW